jgi:hypothetical protein
LLIDSPFETSESFRELQKGITALVKPHLSEKKQLKLAILFDFLCNSDMLTEFFAKKKYKECEQLATTLRKMWDSGVFE